MNFDLKEAIMSRRPPLRQSQSVDQHTAISSLGHTLGGLLRRMSTVTDSDTDDCGPETHTSPSRTPTSSSSMQEMVLTYQQPVAPPGLSQSPAGAGEPVMPGARGRRRASMQDALDHTKINALLYQQQQANLCSSIQEENLGSINLSMSLNLDQSLLTVRLIQARDLTHKTTSINPYARLCLLPNKQVQLQSRVQKLTCNPEFEEEFIFEVISLERSTLEVLIYNFDQFSQDDCIGAVHISLELVDLSEPVVMWKGISPYEKKTEDKDYGDLMFSLGYLSSAGRLTVSVAKARNLRPVEEGKQTASPFVKVSIISNGKRLKKKKTSTKRGTVNPVWNEALVYNLGKESIDSISLEFEVLNDSLLGANESLGSVTVGKKSSGDELAHWNDVLNGKNAIARWHPLKEHPK